MGHGHGHSTWDMDIHWKWTEPDPLALHRYDKYKKPVLKFTILLINRPELKHVVPILVHGVNDEGSLKEVRGKPSKKSHTTRQLNGKWQGIQ